MKVIYLPEVQLYLHELALKLYVNNYFGSEESSVRYVRELWADIENNLPYHTYREAPQYFNRYGLNMLYATFRKNKHTYWYVFFREYRLEGERIFQIRFISNNHTIAQYL